MIDQNTNYMMGSYEEEYWYRAEDHLIDGETTKERYLRMAGIKKYSPFKISDSSGNDIKWRQNDNS